MIGQSSARQVKGVRFTVTEMENIQFYFASVEPSLNFTEIQFTCSITTFRNFTRPKTRFSFLNLAYMLRKNINLGPHQIFETRMQVIKRVPILLNAPMAQFLPTGDRNLSYRVNQKRKPRVAWQPLVNLLGTLTYKLISFRTSCPITWGNGFKLCPIRYNPNLYLR